MTSLLLALQFFTVIPIHKNLPMERKHITGMYSVFPWIGAFIGATACVMLYFEWSSLMTGFTIVLIGIWLSGGLHMDAFIDTSDAFFSYRDRVKRFEILDDPRVGAFGVMAVVLLVVGKVIMIAEVISAENFHWIYVLVIPFLSRTVLVLLFGTTINAKQTGLATFFKQKLNVKWIIPITAVQLFIVVFILGWVTHWLIALTVMCVLMTFICLFRSWALKNFGGVTGDLLGASVEVSEVVLWITVLLLLS